MCIECISTTIFGLDFQSLWCIVLVCRDQSYCGRDWGDCHWSYAIKRCYWRRQFGGHQSTKYGTSFKTSEGKRLKLVLDVCDIYVWVFSWDCHFGFFFFFGANDALWVNVIFVELLHLLPVFKIDWPILQSFPHSLLVNDY